MNLKEAQVGLEYVVKDIQTSDEELNSFLFSLGLYSGEKVSVVRHLKSGAIIAIKNSKYSIDNSLAQAIIIN